MESGEILSSYLYKGKGMEDIDKMIYSMFCRKLATSKSQAEPQMLPPTSDAAKYQFQSVLRSKRMESKW